MAHTAANLILTQRIAYVLRRRAWNNAVKCSIKNVGTKYVGTSASGSCVRGAVETAVL